MLNPIFTQDLRKMINENTKKLEGIQNYSSEEQVIGTWFGKKLYRKTFYRGVLINGNTETINHGIYNVDKIWLDPSHSFAIWPSGMTNNLPFLNVEGIDNSIGVYDLSATSFKLKSGLSRANLSGYITLEYTKNAD